MGTRVEGFLEGLMFLMYLLFFIMIFFVLMYFVLIEILSIDPWESQTISLVFISCCLAGALALIYYRKMRNKSSLN